MHLYSHREPKPSKTAAVVRYGAFGDGLQATSILPWLKERGYHITFYTVPVLHEVLKHDPHVDRFVVQDIDAIPNPELGNFWGALEKKYDKFVNLSESVERTLLAMPGNMNHMWSHEMRNKHLNKNYMEFVHDIAGVPLPVRMKFYPTEEEKAEALDEYNRLGGRVIMWVLSGSAVHKVWPYLDQAIHHILKATDASIVLVGGKDEKMLEQGWEENPRVHLRSGKWSIRHSLTFAQICDLVIGPETGVLNAVAMEPVKKIVFLSHSSVENLTRDWMNTVSLIPKNTSCYPCHKLHVITDAFKYCRESKDILGVAECQVDIHPKRVFDAVIDALAYRQAA